MAAIRAHDVRISVQWSLIVDYIPDLCRLGMVTANYATHHAWIIHHSLRSIHHSDIDRRQYPDLEDLKLHIRVWTIFVETCMQR